MAEKVEVPKVGSPPYPDPISLTADEPMQHGPLRQPGAGHCGPGSDPTSYGPQPTDALRPQLELGGVNPPYPMNLQQQANAEKNPAPPSWEQTLAGASFTPDRPPGQPPQDPSTPEWKND
jgi:hypothetical protein